MQDLRIVLVIIGALAIAALVIHGLWTSRKNRRAPIKEKPLGKMMQEPKLVQGTKDVDGFDQDGIGQVRVISRHGSPVVDADPLVDDPLVDEAVPGLRADAPADPVMAEEPVMAQSAESASQPEVSHPSHHTEWRQPTYAQWQEVYVINVMARNGQPIPGLKLAEVLKLLGFCYGEMAIYHRHLEMNGQGEVLFSLINMVKPGTFNPDTMASFETPGISLFMQLPTQGRGLAHFELMLRAADKLASELDGILCDAQRQPLTEDSLNRYRDQLRSYDSH